MSFEKNIKELENIVSRLENNDINLEESLDLFEKGVSLSKECRKILDNAEKRISVLIESEDGELIKQNFDEFDN